MNISKKKFNKLLAIFFSILFLVSFILYKDYGISIDEESTRLHGLVSFKYIILVFNDLLNLEIKTELSIPNLHDYPYKEYGVSFELISIFFEKLFSVNSYQDIYFMKHILTHFFFLLGVIFMIKIIYNNFGNIFLAFWSGLLLYSTPRIFAHSFFNNKDIIFMSFFIFAIFFTFEFFKKKDIKYLVLSAISLALLTTIRSIGFYFFVLFIVFLFIEILEKKKLRSNLKSLALIFLIYLISIYLLWPYLWANPLFNFYQAVMSMSDYNWQGNVFYLGNFFLGSHLPWHYLLTLIVATNSILLIPLVFTSLIWFLVRFFKRLFLINDKNANLSFWKSDREHLIFYNLVLFLIPLIVIILNSSTLYTGWRHVYFLFPSLIILSSACIFYLFKILNNKKFLKKLLPVFCFLLILNNFYNLIKFHPYQNVYFNSLFAKNANKKFEIDYWGLSNREALYKLVENNEETVSVCNSSFTNLEMSRKMIKLSESEKIFLKEQNYNDCNFIISNEYYVSDPKLSLRYQVPENFKIFDSINRGDIILSKTFKKVQ